MLIVNPHATSTTPLRRDGIARALASELDLTVVQTRYRGHAALFAREAARDGCGLVLTVGGGTVKEAVNGHFTVTAGLGFGTEVVRAIEGLRADGRRRAPGFMCGPRSAISPATPIGASPHSPWN
jgi:diacylglycerol kinase family enzyme